MFKQINFAPGDTYPIPEPVECRAIISLTNPECSEHAGQMVRSPFCAEFKFAHFENYDKMYQTCTWSYPVANILLPVESMTLHMRSTYSGKSTTTETLWEIQL
jgi:hypothetical protein